MGLVFVASVLGFGHGLHDMFRVYESWVRALGL